MGWRWVKRQLGERELFFVRGPEGASGTVLRLPRLEGTVEYVKLGAVVATEPCPGGPGRLALYRIVWRQPTPPPS